jgi:simple sugar transport system ATP-binding protein
MTNSLTDNSSTPPAVQMAGITKTFPGGVVANNNVSLAVEAQTIHAIIGENGAGKSTLMNILFGRFLPDSGRIRVNGQEVVIDTPARAIALGLGLVTQHTTMIPALTALENVILGGEPTAHGVLNTAQALARLEEIGTNLGIAVDWRARAETLSVASLQKAEIVKALYRGAKILILDEPTATLAPQEADALFGILHGLVAQGATVVFITHKMREVMAHSKRVTVLRGGQTVGERLTRDTYPEELLALLIGQRSVAGGAPLVRDEAVHAPRGGRKQTWDRDGISEMRGGVDEIPPIPRLEIRGLEVLNSRRAVAVRDFSFALPPGEIVGVAGVDGSGQHELAEAILGLREAVRGEIYLEGERIERESVAERLARGITFIPEDRHREGLILDFSLAENFLLGRQRDRNFGGGTLLSLEQIAGQGEEMVKNHRVRAGGGDMAARTLSGGNQQKVVIARALGGSPLLLVAMQPTRGLDVDATRYVYKMFRIAQAKGLSILLFSLDLDEIFEISDRIAVMYNGTLMGVVPRAGATPEAVGRLMVGETPAATGSV